jgi:protease IV
MSRNPILRPAAILAISAAWLVMALGCHLPQPIDVRTRVIVEPQPVKDVAQIVEMPLGSAGGGQGNCATKVAIIDVDGLMVNDNQMGLMSLGANPIDQFRAKLDYAARRGDICAVVVRINSPGGGVTACDIMHRDLQQFRAATGLPTVACLMDVATGGAYYLATATDVIVAHPTTVTGGLGVILNLYNLEDMMAQFNIIGVPIKAGTQVDIGSPIRRMPAQSRELLQTMADQMHTRFRDSVLASRPLVLAPDQNAPSKIDANADAGSDAGSVTPTGGGLTKGDLFDGRVILAPQALSIGMVDSIGYLDDAIALAASHSTTGRGGPVRTVMLHQKRDPVQSIYGVTPNRGIQGDILPIDIPGLNRAKLPTFLFMWQPDPSMH